MTAHALIEAWTDWDHMPRRRRTAVARQTALHAHAQAIGADPLNLGRRITANRRAGMEPAEAIAEASQ